MGWGGVTAVALATGMSDRRIRNGLRELDDPDSAPQGRQRRTGGGRQSREAEHPDLIAAWDAIVEPESRGDPQSPLRWTCRSTREWARMLRQKNYQVSHTKVG